MDMIEKFASLGVIHSDFNEFNLLLDNKSKIWVIDFPQMVSYLHRDAEFFFNRDVECINTFFKMILDCEGGRHPNMKDVSVVERMDLQLKASGYDREIVTLSTSINNVQINNTKRYIEVNRSMSEVVEEVNENDSSNEYIGEEIDSDTNSNDLNNISENVELITENQNTDENSLQNILQKIEVEDEEQLTIDKNFVDKINSRVKKQPVTYSEETADMDTVIEEGQNRYIRQALQKQNKSNQRLKLKKGKKQFKSEDQD